MLNTVNQLLFGHYFASYKLVCDDYFLRVSLIKICVVITAIQQGLVRNEKYSRRQFSRVARKDFSLANESRFTVYDTIVIWMQILIEPEHFFFFGKIMFP